MVGDYDLDGDVDDDDGDLLYVSDGDDDGLTSGQGDYYAWYDNQGNVLSITGVSYVG